MPENPVKTIKAMTASGGPAAESSGHGKTEFSPPSEATNETAPPPKRKPREAAGINRSHIVRAAIKVVGRNGRRFQFAEVAKELGVTRGSFTRHFKNVDALREEMARYILHEMLPRRRSNETAKAHLGRLVGKCAEYTKRRPALAELAGRELAVNPSIHPQLILTLSGAVDEIGVKSERRFASLRVRPKIG